MAKFGISLAVLLLAVGSTRLYAVDIAILDSDINTRAYFVETYGGWAVNEHMRYWRGWQYVLDCGKATKYDYIKLTDSQLQKASDLTGVKVLILANTARLSNNQVTVIFDWVKRGGRLIATFGSGYQGFAKSLDESTELKGKTVGLHQLWHDPTTKLFTTDLIPAFVVSARISKAPNPGPTSAFSVGDQLPYGLSGNLLTPRPEHRQTVLAYFNLSDPTWTRPQPAILNTNASKGKVVYFAFAPEYVVTWEFVAWGTETTKVFTCTSSDQVDSTPFRDDRVSLYPAGTTSTDLRKAMKNAIDFMLLP